MADHDNTPRADAPEDTAEETSPMPSWSDPEKGTTSAILIEDSGISVVEFGTGEDFADVACRAVGDPLVEQVTYLYWVNLWVGNNSRITSRLNPIATQIVYDLFRDVRDGRYVATDRERANASRLVADSDGALVFHGPLLITGANESGGPSPFEENFRDWFSQGRGGITQIRDSIRTSVAMLRGSPRKQGCRDRPALTRQHMFPAFPS